MSQVNPSKPRILIVDDEPAVRGILYDLLCETYECRAVGSAREALSLLKSRSYNLVLSDIRMPEMTGLEMIPLVIQSSPDTVVITISGEQNIESAIEAMRAGAFDYIVKPFDYRHVETSVSRALKHHYLLVTKRRYARDMEELVERRTAERDRLASHDPLTGLPNRAFFEGRLAQALTLAAREGRPPAVVLLGIDRLKSVNETLGYLAGDALLRDIAGRLSGEVRGSDTIARWGGNEFALLLMDVRRTEDVVGVAQKIKEVLGPPFEYEGHDLYVTASAGITMYPHDGHDADALLRNAGTARHRARRQGGNNYEFYTAEMNVRAVERLLLEAGLRRALERGEFSLHYQPLIDTSTRKTVGLEALVRWRHPERGLVPPADFIPLAEETGLILPLGEWVLRAACTQARAWQDAGLAPLTVAVNLSARQFRQRDLPEFIARVLKETGLRPEHLQLELTESCVMEDAAFAVEALGALQSEGVGVSVDDFGTGYSSLSYLKRLPIDSLKIDRSFVADAANNDEDAAIVSAIVLLARTLRLEVIAEGVETEEQLSLLRGLGCKKAQGYLFSRPLPADELETLLRKEETQ
jgi:diguanylate cyclase (GGDEF)-like protein